MRISDWSSDVCSSDLQHHRSGVRDVHADLDHRGRNQHIDRPRSEGAHHPVLVLGRHPPVQELDLESGQRTRCELWARSEERRVGKEGDSPGRFRWSQYNSTTTTYSKNNHKITT